MRKLLLAMLVFGPLYAHSDPITFSWTSNGATSDLLSGSGSWTLDDSVLVAGVRLDYRAQITDFQFDWDTSGGPFFINFGTGFITRAFMTFDGSLNLTEFNICASATGSCLFDFHPAIGASSDDWAASLAPGVGVGIRAPQTVIVRVPEPGTLALLGIGLAGMGLARRRKRI